MESETSERPAVVVGALIVNPEGKVLLCRSPKWLDKYTIPGGHIEAGEKMGDAVRREVKEETGLDVSDVRFLVALEGVYDAGFWKKKHFVFLDHACATRSTNVKLNDELHSPIWVPPREALHLDLAPYVDQIIQAYLKTERTKQ